MKSLVLAEKQCWSEIAVLKCNNKPRLYEAINLWLPGHLTSVTGQAAIMILNINNGAWRILCAQR